jgi:glucose/arabinose dehydrogenase
LILTLVGCGASTPASSTTPPNATTTGAAEPSSAPVEAAAGSTPTPEALDKQIKLRRLLDTGGGFIRISLDPATGNLFYLDGKANIYQLDLKAAEPSKGAPVYTAADVGGAGDTSGMAIGPDGAIYVSGNVTEGKNTKAIVRKGTPDGSGKRVWSTLVSTAPYPKSDTPFDHVVNGLAVSPDGLWVYINSGSRTDHGEVEDNDGAFPNTREVPLTSAIFRVPADSKDLTLPNDEAQLKAKGYLFADGTRNAYDLEFAASGDLFAGDNGPDADYPDELNWLREGHHYGFPWRFGNQNNAQASRDYDASKDLRLQKGFFAVDKGTYKNDPNFPKAPMAFTDPVANLGPDGDQFRGDDGSQKDASDGKTRIATFTPHRSPLGLSFDKENALAEPFKGNAFMLSWGSAGGTLSDRGEDLLALKLTKSGDNYQAQVTQIARGFAHPIDSVLIKNKLYVLDYAGAGTIWEVTFP